MSDLYADGVMVDSLPEALNLMGPRNDLIKVTPVFHPEEGDMICHTYITGETPRGNKVVRVVPGGFYTEVETSGEPIIKWNTTEEIARKIYNKSLIWVRNNHPLNL